MKNCKKALDNPKFILLDEADFFRKNEQEDVRHVSERYIGIYSSAKGIVEAHLFLGSFMSIWRGSTPNSLV